MPYDTRHTMPLLRPTSLHAHTARPLRCRSRRATERALLAMERRLRLVESVTAMVGEAVAKKIPQVGR